MFQNRTLGREESLLRFPADLSSNLLDHVDSWYELAPRFIDEYWRVQAFNISLAGPGLLNELRGLGGAGGSLEFALDRDDGFGHVRNIAECVFNAVESQSEWNAGQHTGTLVDLVAGRYEGGRPRAGLRGDVRFAAAGTAVWQSAEMPLRYGSALSGITWQADLVRNDAGAVLPSARVILETGVTAAGVTTWTTSATVQTAAQLEAGFLDLPGPVICDRFRLTIELDFLAVGQAAHRESATLRTSAFFLAGAWVVLDSPWWTIKSLGDLVLRSELGHELRPAGYDGAWDICLVRVPFGMEVRGRRGERLRARIRQPGGALRVLEIHAATDAWYEEA